MAMRRSTYIQRRSLDMTRSIEQVLDGTYVPISFLRTYLSLGLLVYIRFGWTLLAPNGVMSGPYALLNIPNGCVAQIGRPTRS